MTSAITGHELPDDPIAYWEELGFDVTWGSPRFGEPLSLYVRLKDLDIFFVGEGRDADEVFRDAWMHYVAHHIDTVMAWTEAKTHAEPFGLRVVS